MTGKTGFRMSVIGALVAGLAACGGGGGGAAGSGQTTQGVITGFGSVFVNGVEYDTAGTSVEVEGGAGSEADLDVGMVVKLEGSVNADGKTGTASRISFADEVEGIVLSTSIDPATGTGTLDVMGQTVTVTAETVFESRAPGVATSADIAANNIVEVSGYSDGAGNIVATRLEVKKASWQPGDEVELKGVVSNLAPAAQTFTLGSLTVDYSSASTGLMLRDGVYVEVKSTQGINAGNQLVASAVDLEDDGEKGYQGSEGEEFELQGAVTAAVNADRFMLDGQPVKLTAGTEFEGGDLSQLVSGAEVKVEGRFDASGVLVAEQVSFGAEVDTEVQGAVDAVDTAAGTVTIGAQTVRVTSDTIFKDDSSTGDRYFNLSAFKVGDQLEIEAYTDASTGALVALKVERK